MHHTITMRIMFLACLCQKCWVRRLTIIDWVDVIYTKPISSPSRCGWSGVIWAAYPNLSPVRSRFADWFMEIHMSSRYFERISFYRTAASEVPSLYSILKQYSSSTVDVVNTPIFPYRSLSNPFILSHPFCRTNCGHVHDHSPPSLRLASHWSMGIRLPEAEPSSRFLSLWYSNFKLWKMKMELAVGVLESC